MNLKQNTTIYISLILLIIISGCTAIAPVPQEVSQESPSAELTETSDVAETENFDDASEPTEEFAVTEAESADEAGESTESSEVAESESTDDASEPAEEVVVAEVSPESPESEEAEAHHTGEPNRLIDEKSPYLLQHAYNPVDWYPWGEEAFAKAAAEGKPIFLSVGYSTCHWCHVMEDESFEDEEVAALMNEAFISIKVDREERPDIDGIYMNVAQLLNQRGGWPLNVLLTPDQKPFFAATYIPKESRFQRTGMMDLIPQVQQAWISQHGEILAYADEIVTALQPPQMSQLTDLGSEDLLGTNSPNTAYQQLSQRFDPVHGGFGTAPKFPSPHNLLFLLRYWQRTGDAQALNMVETTLQSMRRGGVYDQIGYGYHRYSTDAGWKLPHFEKMLYDQAMLALAYTETYQATENEFYQDVAREIFTYVLRDMTDPEGPFYSAEDADSEGEEGIFYHWSIAELIEILGEEDANILIVQSAMTQEGNFLEEATREPTGKNIIYWHQPQQTTADALGITLDELESRIDTIRPKLFEARKTRIHPYKDDKVLTDWNGLMIAAFAKAGRAFHEPAYTDAANNAAQFLLTTMRNEEGRLLHRYRQGEAAILANIDDYAFLTWGLLELYEATFDLTYLEEAIALNSELEAHFWDEFVGGFYFTPDDGEKLITRQKELYDGAIPSGNSIAMLNLMRLGRITANADYEAKAAELAYSFGSQISANPTAYTQLMSAIEFGVGPSYEVIIVGEAEGSDTDAMLTALRDEYVPNKVVLLREPSDDAPILSLAEYTEFYYAIDDKATAYVCQDYICEFPTNDPAQMVALLVGQDE
ncbi:MAG: thioredoxin domain-containing protein [Chloroflexota bacterium]